MSNKKLEPVGEITYSGSDVVMDSGDRMSIETLKACYLKHACNDESIGWDELTDMIGNALAQIMGDEEFCRWNGGS
jgi:hypothetical protein